MRGGGGGDCETDANGVSKVQLETHLQREKS